MFDNFMLLMFDFHYEKCYIKKNFGQIKNIYFFKKFYIKSVTYIITLNEIINDQFTMNKSKNKTKDVKSKKSLNKIKSLFFNDKEMLPFV